MFPKPTDTPLEPIACSCVLLREIRRGCLLVELEMRTPKMVKGRAFANTLHGCSQWYLSVGPCVVNSVVSNKVYGSCLDNG
jgi:hypothetical protein